MKSLLLPILLLSPVPATTGVTTDLAIRQTYIACFANHWRGEKTIAVRGTDESVKLTCGGFWKADRNSALPSPFYLLGPDHDPQPIPYSEWRPALEDILEISEEPK
jgi:hypothetical protein